MSMLFPDPVQQPGPKPIETVYKHFRFRSRLEARWALWFDLVEIDWEYELQGYALPSGWYLPDFWLHRTRYFVEIKPFKYKQEAEVSREWTLCRELAESSQHRAVVVYGDPFDVITTGAHLATSDIAAWGSRALTKNPVEAAVKARQHRFEHKGGGADR